MPNTVAGIALQDVSLVTIGGTAAGAGNLISGNNHYAGPGGVYIFDEATQNLVEGNLIGTDITGLNALPDTLSTEYGVLIAGGASTNTIGGTTAAARNIISGNYGWGVGIDGPTTTGNVVVGNFIGPDLNGTAALGNAAQNPQSIGIIISNAPDNTVGGTTAGAGNVISGNSQYGVEITDVDYVNQNTGTSATGNVVAGNWIGTNRDGTAAVGNAADGVLIDTGASNNTIGGTAAGAGNLISGNATGVEINDASSIYVQGNLIGTDWTGTLPVGNTGAGVLVDGGSSANTIGGPVGGARNVISGNAEGVEITGTTTTGTDIAGNLIGTDITGQSAVGNLSAGVTVSGASGTTIGGLTSLAQNVISGNSGDGIDLSGGATNTLIENNYIGVDQTGTQPVGNQGSGLSVNGASGVTIGGTLHGSGNVISANAQSGVSIGGGSGTGIIVVGNFIGTDYTGTNAVGNLGDGVAVSDPPGVTIGGTVAGSHNIISGNMGAGIGLFDNADRRADRGQLDRHRHHAAPIRWATAPAS